jgi:hypothetical protein
VSLRRDVHAAFDEIEPSKLGMSERVVETVLRDRPRQGSRRLLLHMRAPLSLVATFLLIAVVAAVFIGGGLVRDWTATHHASPATKTNRATLSQLEAVPLNFPGLKQGDTCPNSPGANSLGYDYGSGPVYLNGRLIPEIATSWGYLYDLTFYSAADLTGPVLVRGRDLLSGRPIVFVGPSSPISSTSGTGKFVAGGVVDTIGSEPLYGELALDAGHPPLRDASTGFGIWYIRLGVSRGWTGCWGMQIGNLDFQEIITGYSPPPAAP